MVLKDNTADEMIQLMKTPTEEYQPEAEVLEKEEDTGDVSVGVEAPLATLCEHVVPSVQGDINKNTPHETISLMKVNVQTNRIIDRKKYPLPMKKEPSSVLYV